ncbi:zf-HC2 domain-containing protein [Hydrogenophaga sp.]|uniref:zf-HC2 domain-containing protein n=1 Tax=Hydrogenophaga sp. TaxID=1904254 RepID=UPI00273616D1|nr:zf-HC2 domain-containing protein [Hydrogenophaga sp.]MDP3886128.1 zf-HC2 domain-containing protein [Hydrogenophaga sp.]
MLNCREVTRLVSESQERKLSVVEKMSLNLHLMMCDGCKNFSLQVPFLRKAMKAYSERLDELIEDHGAAPPPDKEGKDT